MSDSQAPKKSSNAWIVILLLLLLILGGAYYYSLQNAEPVEGQESITAGTEAVEEIEGALEEPELDLCADETRNRNPDGTLIDECLSGASGIAVDDASAASNVSSGFDLSKAKTERILGDRSAPIRISEHSSFSCGHCGKFHRETFKAFKESYIDTGKAYLVFSDFPLNAPALHATKISRCVNDEQYFDFVEELFAKQDDWAYDANYLSFLKDTAERYGVDDEMFSACLGSAELQETILKRMQAISKQFEVRSTPSFVVNNQKLITGALPIAQFEKAIETAIAEIEAENSPE